MRRALFAFCILHSALCILPAHAEIDSDLKPVRVPGLGLGSLPDALKPRLRVRLFLSNDEHDAFPERAPEEKFRVFATNEVGALPLGDGGAGLLDLTGADCPWLGDDPATFWVEGRVHGASASLATEVSLDGAVIGRDAIRIRVAPFLVLSNCDVAEKLFYANLGTPDWEAFALDVTNAVSVFLPAVETPHTPFPQDVAELGWGGIETNGNPVVWSMERNGFKELLANDVGVFSNPSVSKMGGNVEAIPPTPLYPHGRIVVGSNLPEDAKSFLRTQELQTEDGQLIELDLDWLKVGHVDEVMAVVPIAEDGFKILLGDLTMATNLLDNEIRSLTVAKQRNPGEWTDGDEAYLSFLSEKLAPYRSPENESAASRVKIGLSAIRAKLLESLSIASDDVIPLPVLYPLAGVPETGFSEADKSLPNPINMVVLCKEDRTCRILVPNPLAESFVNHLETLFQSIGCGSGDVWLVNTEGPHSFFGEAHCATTSQRRKSE